MVNNEQWAAFGEVEWVPLAVFRQAAEINLLGTIRVSQAFLPLVRKVKGEALLTLKARKTLFHCSDA